MNQKAGPNIFIVIAQLDRAHLLGEPFGELLLIASAELVEPER